MKRFMDYQPTKDELRDMFFEELFEENPKWLQEELDKDPGGDREKYCIAHLLFKRGLRKECREMLESIEDETYRGKCQYRHNQWAMWEEGYE